ncbi:type I restriction endonuclease [Desulfosediminicola sp.]|uniref:type I restriction endonuclease n=1 Tax=Desulfosediminicola sp. TaxID=2886825 RepID=UPI003AF2F357
MDFIDQLQALSARIQKQISITTTEEATKNAFVMPFIQALGYDVFDPSEVIPEYTADVGSKKGEKVDYAISIEGQPTMLFECKTCAANLQESHAAQLRRYFHVTEARIGVLTNGAKYMFFSDLDEPNIMDSKPFMEIDLLDLEEQLVSELKKLAKSTFELDTMLSTANNLKYSREIKTYLDVQRLAPSSEFVKLVISEAYPGPKTQQVVEQFTPIVKQAFSSLISDRINDRLKSALDTNAEFVSQDPLPTTEEEKNVDEKGIVTTGEELEGFYIVRAILRNVIDIDRVTHRDTKSYFGILLDDNNRKPICRLHFNARQKYIGIIDEGKNETRHPIDSLSEIYNYTDLIRESLLLYEDAETAN